MLNTNTEDIEGILYETAEKSPVKNENRMRHNLKGDWGNIALLLFLYMLQVVPLGIGAALPIILQNRGNITYEDQAQFSFVTWPFSLKLLWAPAVDSIYCRKFGRRKSWLVPAQYLLGLMLLLISYYSSESIEDENSNIPPNIKLLTVMFFCCNFLSATQDIAVDAWALTMLKRKNVGHSSSCGSIGGTVGFFFGYVVFVELLSPEFCNTWIRSVPQPYGLISFSGYLQFWGIVFIISTTFVAIFKKDRETALGEEEEHCCAPRLDFFQTYKLLLNILKLPPMKEVVVILLTCKLGFSAVEAISPLKLIDAGISKDKIALMSVPMIPMKIIFPIIISKYIIGPRPANIFVHTVPYRLFVDICICLMVYATPYMITKTNIPWYYYGILLLILGVHQVMIYCMNIALTAFFTRISDPSSGGTYMTLLNTLANLSGTWPSTVSLWFVDKLTWRSCVVNNICSSTNGKKICTAQNSCSIMVDGFYIESVCSVFIAILWLRFAGRRLRRLQDLQLSVWRITSTQSSSEPFLKS